MREQKHRFRHDCWRCIEIYPPQHEEDPAASMSIDKYADMLDLNVLGFS
jgi:hypothetical protein